MKPIKCPKCNAREGNIDNAEDMCELLGLDAIERQNKTWMCGKCNYFFNDDEAEFPDVEYNLEKMKLNQIANLIFNDWHNIPEKASRYLETMSEMESISDYFGHYDMGVEVVAYFLANAKSWQGKVARDVKKHLNDLIKKRENERAKKDAKIEKSKGTKPLQNKQNWTEEELNKDKSMLERLNKRSRENPQPLIDWLIDAEQIEDDEK